MSTSENREEKVLAALADPSRLHLLNLLAALGQATATTLGTRVTISRQAVVKHLGVLSKAGLVSSHRAGRETRYTICTEQIESTARWMANLAADWDRKLGIIRHMAEMDEKS